MNFQIRAAVPDDQVPLIDCDIKCFDLAWSSDAWRFIGDNYAIRVATVSGTPVAFSAYHYVEDEREVFLPKIGVKPHFRRRGIGKALLAECASFGRQLGAKRLASCVPESIVLRPREPQDIVGWLIKTGWKAEKLFRKAYTVMGEKEDGVRFILEL